MPQKFAVSATLFACLSCACSGDGVSVGSGRDGAAARPDPCSLVTTAEAAAILGVAVEPSKPEGLSSAAACQYVAPSAESVTLQVHDGSAREFDAYVRTAEESFGSKSFPVPDIGDQAVFNAEQLIVRQGSDFFVMTIGRRITDQERLKIGSELGRTVVARLGS